MKNSGIYVSQQTAERAAPQVMRLRGTSGGVEVEDSGALKRGISE